MPRRRIVVRGARVLVATAVVVAALVGGAGSGIARPVPGAPPQVVDGHVGGEFRWPASTAPVAVFDPPDSPWGPGHRGIDLAVDAGTRVGAMGDGVVGFAGVVAGQAWVSVDHRGDLRTTVGPMATMAVATGAGVAAGEVLGTAAATAHATASVPATGRLHVSARRHGEYIDPARLVGAWVPTLVGPGDSRWE